MLAAGAIRLLDEMGKGSHQTFQVKELGSHKDNFRFYYYYTASQISRGEWEGKEDINQVYPWTSLGPLATGPAG